ncbi:hypothetical protein AB0J83_44715 [Actinoplanes sp. NPDC049596]|uniref:hypothetical protein n=1 Tax=unclassified Actinoplanes TaxID=2626549 RepID=UPI0034236BAC
MTTDTQARLLSGEHLHRSITDGGQPVYWKVVVSPADGVIERRIFHGRDKHDLPEWPTGTAELDWEPESVIWPAWSPSPDVDGERRPTPLAEAGEHWSRLGDRLRESAKWMSTVAGAALALLLGTSPLGDLGQARFTWPAALCGVAGLILMSATLLLLLWVLRPSAVSFAQVQNAAGRHNPLVSWRCTVERQQDLYLPCGVNTLRGLRHAIIVEGATLEALACAIQRGATAGAPTHKILLKACEARVARLRDLKGAVAEVAAIGEFYRLRRRSALATTIGVVCAAIGLCFVIAALAMVHN